MSNEFGHLNIVDVMIYIVLLQIILMKNIQVKLFFKIITLVAGILGKLFRILLV